MTKTVRMKVTQDWAINTSEEMIARLKNSTNARAPLYERAKQMAAEKGYISPVGKTLQGAAFSVEVLSQGEARLVMEWDQPTTPREAAKPKLVSRASSGASRREIPDAELQEYME